MKQRWLCLTSNRIVIQSSRLLMSYDSESSEWNWHFNRIADQLIASDSIDMEINVQAVMTSLEHDSFFDLTQKSIFDSDGCR